MQHFLFVFSCWGQHKVVKELHSHFCWMLLRRRRSQLAIKKMFLGWHACDYPWLHSGVNGAPKQGTVLILQEAKWATQEKPHPIKDKSKREQSQMEGTSVGTPFAATTNTTVNGKNRKEKKKGKQPSQDENDKNLTLWPNKEPPSHSQQIMEDISHFSLAGTQPTPGGKTTSQNWEFLVAVIVSAISISIFIALLAKWHVVRRYLASYRHTRLRETDTVSQCEPSGLFCTH